jgi:DMSO/TMAO reductase YedYZ molybdopterin-dependent catalytic subunit
MSIDLPRAIELAQADKDAGHIKAYSVDAGELWAESDQGWQKLWPLDERRNPFADL